MVFSHGPDEEENENTISKNSQFCTYTFLGAVDRKNCCNDGHEQNQSSPEGCQEFM